MTTSRWTEVADGIHVRRYAFYDQNIVAITGRGETLVVDTRTTYPQAREILDDLRAIGLPPVTVVVNTHGHYDHAFGNRVFRPAVIWGHARSGRFLERTAETHRAATATEHPELAADLAEVVIDPPDRLVDRAATIEVGGRPVDLAHIGRGHTDNDLIVTVPDADTLCAGDLLENDAVPSFGDGFPIDWVATAAGILARTGERTLVIPGHGRHAGRTFVERQLAEITANAELARRVHAGDLDLEAAIAASLYPADRAREPLERALAQLRGDLDVE